jgi:putative DNA primase/helicase
MTTVNYSELLKESMAETNEARHDNGDQVRRREAENDEPAEGRPCILITENEFEFNQNVIAALALHPQLFQRGGNLVTVIRNAKKNKRISRKAGTPTISVLTVERIREMMTEVAVFEKVTVTKKGNEKIVPAHPPGWSAGQIAARGEWDRIRHLAGVVETPVLLADGRILDRPGWDEDSELLFEPAMEFPPVPDVISLSRATEAADEILELVQDFPFAAKHHFAVFLAAALTPFARHAIDGPCPAFLFDGNVPGCGKTLQADIISIMATGRTMPRTAWREDDAELRKTITALVLEGDLVCLFDNLGNGIPFGGPSIDAALTGVEWKDRILGFSKTTGRLPLTTVFYASGNNLTLVGDTERRVILSRLKAREEHPEERSGFKIPRLVEHVQEHRGRLVVAALTILKGFVQAGRPRQDIPPFGSFESWSRVVREPVVWATKMDPRAGREGLRQINVQTNSLGLLLEGWEKLQDGQRGLTVAEALRRLEADKTACTAKHGQLRDLMMEWSRNKDLPGSRIVGRQLRAIKARVIGGKMLVSNECQGVQEWKVVCNA